MTMKSTRNNGRRPDDQWRRGGFVSVPNVGSSGPIDRKLTPGSEATSDATPELGTDGTGGAADAVGTGVAKSGGGAEPIRVGALEV